MQTKWSHSYAQARNLWWKLQWWQPLNFHQKQICGNSVWHSLNHRPPRPGWSKLSYCWFLWQFWEDIFLMNGLNQNLVFTSRLLVPSVREIPMEGDWSFKIKLKWMEYIQMKYRWNRCRYDLKLRCKIVFDCGFGIRSMCLCLCVLHHMIMTSSSDHRIKPHMKKTGVNVDLYFVPYIKIFLCQHIYRQIDTRKLYQLCISYVR